MDVATLVAQAREKATAHDHAGAQKLAKQALSLAPADPAARLAMVFVRYSEKRIKPLEKAIAAALEVVTDPIERARCHAYMASIYAYYTGPDWWWAHAVAHARLAVEEAPNFAGGYLALALALERRHRWKAAADAVDIACSLQPDLGYLHRQQQIRNMLAQLATSFVEARTQVQTEPTAANWIRLASLHGYHDEFDDAFTALDRAAAADPKEKHVALWRKFWMVEAGRTPVTLKLKTVAKTPAKKKPAKKRPAKKKKAVPAKPKSRKRR